MTAAMMTAEITGLGGFYTELRSYLEQLLPRDEADRWLSRYRAENVSCWSSHRERWSCERERVLDELHQELVQDLCLSCGGLCIDSELSQMYCSACLERDSELYACA